MENTKTIIRKSYHGWSGETVTTVGNKDWKITTLKRSDGSISTVAQAGKMGSGEGYTTFSFMMYQDPSVRLNSVKARATSKKVGDVHSDGLEKFEKYINENPT